MCNPLRDREWRTAHLLVTTVDPTSHLYQIKKNLKKESMMSTFAIFKKQMLLKDEWNAEHKKSKPQFLYWQTVLDLELLLFEHMKSIHDADFDLHVSSTKSIMVLYHFYLIYLKHIYTE